MTRRLNAGVALAVAFAAQACGGSSSSSSGGSGGIGGTIQGTAAEWASTAGSTPLAPPPRLAVGGRGGNEGTAYAIKRDGTLWAWGYGGNGQIGDGQITKYYPPGWSDSQRSEPVLVGSDFSTVTTNGASTYAIKTDGSLWAWGSWIFLLDGTQVAGPWLTPTQIGTGFVRVVTKSEGGGFAAQRTDGTWVGPVGNLYGFDLSRAAYVVPAGVWGVINSDYSLWLRSGTGTLCGTADADKQVGYAPEQRGVGASSLEYTARTIGVIKRDGTLWMFGEGQDGQLGVGFIPMVDTAYGTRVPAPLCTPAKIGSGFASVRVAEYSAYYTLAVKTDGTLVGWGRGQGLGIAGGPFLSPVTLGSGFVEVAAGADFAIAIKSDGSLWGWGSNRVGQMGFGGHTAGDIVDYPAHQILPSGF